MTCWRGDGLGLRRLDEVGVPYVIVSTEPNPVVAVRAEKLRARCVHGVDDKLAVVRAEADAVGAGARSRRLSRQRRQRCGRAWSAVGLPVVPADAWPEVVPLARWVLERAGGRRLRQGALRRGVARAGRGSRRAAEDLAHLRGVDGLRLGRAGREHRVVGRRLGARAARVDDDEIPLTLAGSHGAARRPAARERGAPGRARRSAPSRRPRSRRRCVRPPRGRAPRGCARRRPSPRTHPRASTAWIVPKITSAAPVADVVREPSSADARASASAASTIAGR